jgi:hypothetical protein
LRNEARVRTLSNQRRYASGIRSKDSAHKVNSGELAGLVA